VRSYIAGLDLRLTGPKPSPWLFPDASDPARPRVAEVFRTDVWRRLLEAVGLPHLKPHGARHSYGTNLLRATGDIHYVAQQPGQSSVKVTEDYYLHQYRASRTGVEPGRRRVTTSHLR
jgi:integrase